MLVAQLIGPAAFLLIGLAMVIAGLVVPAGALTDDGHPLGAFLLLFGGGFSAMGLVWGAIAYFGLRGLDRAHAEREAQRQHILRHGTRVVARVVGCKCDGYLDVQNRFWTDIDIEYDIPGAGRHRGTVRRALSQEALDEARAGGTMTVLVDASFPYAVELVPEP